MAALSPSAPGGATASESHTYSGLRKDSVFYAAVSKFREAFREEKIPSDYSVWWHYGLINAVGLSLVLLAGWLAGGPRRVLSDPVSLGLVLFGFALCNYFEYSTHRYNLHAPLVHTRHSHTHHRFFTDRVMEFDSFRDAHTIFFPQRAPYFIAVFICALSILPVLIFGLQAGSAFACTLAWYYVSYETLHLAYHAPPDSFLGSLPGVGYLRRHHQVHHSQALMGKWNFNITWPIADYIFGTTYRGPMSAAGVPDVKAADEAEASRLNASPEGTKAR